MRITVVGGCGAMGRWIVNYLKRFNGLEVIVSDPEEIEGENMARRLGIKYEKDNRKAVSDSNIVIVSVPIEVAPRVMEEVGPCVREGSLLVEITSIKTEVVSSMVKHVPQGVELLSVHPMFGPRVKSIKGRVVVLIPVRQGEWFSKVKSFLEGEGADIVVTTTEEHDRMMGIVQGLTHFASMVFAGVIREMNVDLRSSRKFSSPVYEAFLPMVYRIICQNPELYAQMQVYNPHVLKIQEMFVSQAIDLKRDTENRNVNGIVKRITACCRSFANTESSTALLSMSDRIVSTVQREKNILEGLVGKKICLENVQTGRIHIGVLRKVCSDFVEIEESKKKVVSLNLFNVVLLDEKATMEVRRSVFGDASLDFSVILPESFDGEFCREILEKFLSEAFKVELLEVYVGKSIPEGFKSVNLRVFFPRDEDLSEIRSRAQEILSKLGGRIR
ncbi:MAG: prephenate dehydrogenase/arogenate dehydrogenase family protein [Thermoproteota archaeon]